MSTIFLAVKQALLSFFPNRSMQESMMRYDFKIGDPRLNFMQLCFSPLAAWPLFVLIAAIYLDPTKYFFTLQRILPEESSFGLFLLSGQFSTMISAFFIFFLIQFNFKKEYLFESLIFYFLAKSDIHIHFATAAVLGIYLARASHLWRLFFRLESRTRKIWNISTGLIFGSCISVIGLSLYGLDQLQAYGFFSGSLTANRFEFLTLLILALYLVQFLSLSIWGHFYIRLTIEPSFLPIYFTTANWINRISLRPQFRDLLKNRVQFALREHLNSAAQFQQIKDQSLGPSMNYLGITLDKEISYLRQASSRLTVD